MSEHGGIKRWLAVTAAVALTAACGPNGSDEPVSAQDYTQVLAEVDTSLRDPFAALAKGDKTAFATTTQALRAGAEKLDGTSAPEPVQTTQDSLVTSLRGLSDVVEEAGTSKRACPAAAPAAEVLASDEAQQVRAKALDLAGADSAFAFGAFLPAAPAEQKRQLKNGAFVKKGGTGGVGELEIKNGAGDTTVSLVGKDPKKPVFTVYVRGGGKYTVKGVESGTYQIYSASGVDWDAKKKGFTRDCAFSKFERQVQIRLIRYTLDDHAGAGGRRQRQHLRCGPGSVPGRLTEAGGSPDFVVRDAARPAVARDAARAGRPCGG